MIDTLGSRLRRLRESKRLNQAQVARLIDVTRSSLCCYENDTRQPSLDILIRLATLYRVSTDYLLGCHHKSIGNENRYTNASIDIFPIDGTPNNSFLRKIYFFRVLYHRALMSLCYKDSIDRRRPRGKAERLLLWVMERLPVEKMTTPYKQKEKIDKLLRKQKVEGAEYIGNIMGAYRTKEIVPSYFYGEGKMYQFEDIELRGMDKFDEYLTWTYGDYMKLPPEDKRKTHFKIIEIHGKKVD